MAVVFISGVAGFLGGHLAQSLICAGHEVWGVDNFLGGDAANVPLGTHFFEEDCCDLAKMKDLLTASHATVVYHCAAAPHEGLSVFSPTVVTQNTFMSTVALATAAVHTGVKRFVFLSSMSRYGRGYAKISWHPSVLLGETGFEAASSQPHRGDGIPQFVPFTEDMPTAPVDPYGIAKVASEEFCRVLGDAHDMEVVIAVPHNLYGPRQRYHDPYRNVAAIMVNLMLQGRQPIIYGDGTQQRVFSYVSDAIEPLVKMGFAPGLAGEVFNIGPDDKPITINYLAHRIGAIMFGHDHKVTPEYHPERPCEVKTAWPSSDKARRLLGFQAKVSLDVGLAALAGWIRSHGPRKFEYHLPIELPGGRNIPRTWLEQLF